MICFEALFIKTPPLPLNLDIYSLLLKKLLLTAALIFVWACFFSVVADKLWVLLGAFFVMLVALSVRIGLLINKYINENGRMTQEKVAQHSDGENLLYCISLTICSAS